MLRSSLRCSVGGRGKKKNLIAKLACIKAAPGRCGAESPDLSAAELREMRCGVGRGGGSLLADGNGAVRFSWEERCPAGGVAGRSVLNAVGDAGAGRERRTCFPRAVWESRRAMLPFGSVAQPRTDLKEWFVTANHPGNESVPSPEQDESPANSWKEILPPSQPRPT